MFWAAGSKLAWEWLAGAKLAARSSERSRGGGGRRRADINYVNESR